MKAGGDATGRELGAIIDELGLEPMQTRFLRTRWLQQLVWIEAQATGARRRYYVLRLTTVIGAVIVPALVTAASLGGTVATVAQVSAWIVSLVVALCAAIEGFFHYGARWRHYRGVAERLKREAWLFFELSDPYNGDGRGYPGAYPTFVQRVEQIFESDVESYLTTVVTERTTGSAGGG